MPPLKLENLTVRAIESMSPEKREKIVQRIYDEHFRISNSIRIALQGGFRSLEDLMSLGWDRPGPSTPYVSAQGLREEDPCIPSCGPYE